ncbi:hypothetical protein CTheo_5143 [Ceratobasidium theobromae]|uniref:Uncharacterized protein n=1 Tax=Ceratobasidium theobromae TaxID=1582974 RepID=A0A5N5QIZ1_9AGAM|nr:hypothetical protein CTheo_5143 [Ceratobasidium theobromae]
MHSGGIRTLRSPFSHVNARKSASDGCKSVPEHRPPKPPRHSSPDAETLLLLPPATPRHHCRPASLAASLGRLTSSPTFIMRQTPPAPPAVPAASVPPRAALAPIRPALALALCPDAPHGHA